MTYVIGNLIGRFVASYLLVLLANFLIARFHFRIALRKTHSLWGVLATVIVFVLGLIGYFV